MPYAKNHIRVKVPSRSGFDKSHRNSGTSFCGTLTPLLLDELIPNSRVSLKIPIAVQMPPLASDTFMNVKYAVEAFFVPMRLLCASFEDFFCDFPRRIYTNFTYSSSQSGGSFTDVRARLPVFRLEGGSYDQYLGPGSLLDYLGFRSGISAGDTFDINPLPLVAYHLVWQEYYRNPRVQNPAFSPSLGLAPSFRSPAGDLGFAYMPYNYFHASFIADDNTTAADNSLISITGSSVGNMLCADGVSAFALRQRNFGLDYFTGARVSAQQGLPMQVSVDIPAGQDILNQGGEGSFTIAQLRAANSLQQFRERNNIPSPRLVDQVKARYNANLSDGVAQRPICIGSAKFDVSTYGINQTAGDSTSTANPFSSVANQYGRASASGNSFVIEDFVANEPGYILVLGSLVPEVSYSSGVPRLFKRYLVQGSITDMACSLLQNVGDQPIFDYELEDTLNSSSPQVFGYQDRYADFMFMPNQIHGQMRENMSLESFVLQRSFASAQLNSSFLEIPKDYMDGVMATSAALAGMTYWYDTYLQYHVSMPLAEFSIPSLQDPAYEHGESVSLRRNGQLF